MLPKAVGASLNDSRRIAWKAARSLSSSLAIHMSFMTFALLLVSETSTTHIRTARRQGRLWVPYADARLAFWRQSCGTLRSFAAPSASSATLPRDSFRRQRAAVRCAVCHLRKTRKAVVQGHHAADNALGSAKSRSGGYSVDKYTNLRMRNPTAAPCRRVRSHTSLCEG